MTTSTTQQVLVVEKASKSGTERSVKLRTSLGRPIGGKAKSLEMLPLTPLSISYEKLLPMIQGLSDLVAYTPGTDPSKEIIARDVPSIKNMTKVVAGASVQRINSIHWVNWRRPSPHRWDNHFPTSRPHPDTAPHGAQSHGPRKPWANPVRIQRVVNYVLGRHCTAGPSWPSHSQRTIFGGTRFITLQCHLGAHMATLHESHPLYISSNGEFPYQRWAN
ncbi:hypothetical protein AAG906_016425 [Vitis piasezkii]